jgi:hypothetical protein
LARIFGVIGKEKLEFDLAVLVDDWAKLFVHERPS